MLYISEMLIEIILNIYDAFDYVPLVYCPLTQTPVGRDGRGGKAVHRHFW